MVCYSRTVLTSAAQLSDGSEVNISTRISSLERTFCTISTVGFWFGLVGFFCCCFQEIYPVQLSYVPKIPRCRCWLGSQDLLLGAKAFSLYCVKVERGRKGLFCALGCVEFFIGYYWSDLWFRQVVFETFSTLFKNSDLHHLIGNSQMLAFCKSEGDTVLILNVISHLN